MEDLLPLFDDQTFSGQLISSDNRRDFFDLFPVHFHAALLDQPTSFPLRAMSST